MNTMRSAICRRCHRIRYVDHRSVCMLCERALRDMERPRPHTDVADTLPPPEPPDTLQEIPPVEDDE